MTARGKLKEQEKLRGKMEENCIIQSELWEEKPFKVPLRLVANPKLTVNTNKKAKPQNQKPWAKSG